MDKQPVPWEAYKADHCDIVITYSSGKSWTKFTTVKAARFLSRRATKQYSTKKIEVRICVEAYSQQGKRSKIHYSKFEVNTWTRESGWTKTYSMTNDGYLY